MTELYDMHCHILPGIDDGAATMEETMQTLHEMYRQGIRGVIVTPHYYPERYTPSARDVLEILEQVKRQCEREQLDMTLLPGQECFYHTGLTEQLNRKEVLTLADSRYVLVEYDTDCPFFYIMTGIRQLQQNGYIPILAHFERYECLRNEKHLMEVRQQGCFLQMNFDTLLQKNPFLLPNRFRKLLRDGLVDFLGSDCHGLHFRPPRIDRAYQWIADHTDETVCRQMLQTNVQNILFNRR